LAEWQTRDVCASLALLLGQCHRAAISDDTNLVAARNQCLNKEGRQYGSSAYGLAVAACPYEDAHPSCSRDASKSAEKLGQLLELKYHTVSEAADELGDVPVIRDTFVGFQRYLYDELTFALPRSFDLKIRQRLNARGIGRGKGA
jgi:hypothetical protein